MMRIIEDAFLCNRKFYAIEIAPNFLLHKKRSAKDAHSRERFNMPGNSGSNNL